MAGVGATLASLGQRNLQESMRLAGEVADQEAQRNRQNKMLEQQEKAGKVQLGSTLGGLGVAAAGQYAASSASTAALAGGATAAEAAAAGAEASSWAGPWGILIGGAIGAIAGGLFD